MNDATEQPPMGRALTPEESRKLRHKFYAANDHTPVEALVNAFLASRAAAAHCDREMALRRLAAKLCAYDVSADPVPDGVEVPEDYEWGINEAGERLHGVLDGDALVWDATAIAEHDGGPDGMRTHMQLPDGGCTCSDEAWQ